MEELEFFIGFWGDGLAMYRERPNNSYIKVCGGYTFEEARKVFHHKLCKMCGKDPQETELSFSDGAFYRSPAFYRRDGKIGLDNSLLDKYGCPDSVYRGV